MSTRTTALTEALEEEIGDIVETVSDDEHEVYLCCRQDGYGPLASMDRACVIAHDHGFVPRGITSTGAVRFQPRQSVEKV